MHFNLFTYAKARSDFLCVSRRRSAHVEALDTETNGEIRPRSLALVSVKICAPAFKATMYVCDTYFDIVGDSFNEPVGSERRASQKRMRKRECTTVSSHCCCGQIHEPASN